MQNLCKLLVHGFSILIIWCIFSCGSTKALHTSQDQTENYKEEIRYIPVASSIPSGGPTQGLLCSSCVGY